MPKRFANCVQGPLLKNGEESQVLFGKFPSVKKICTKCLIERDFEQFNKRSKSKDGLTYVCKICEKNRQQKRYQDNKEEICARTNAYYHENKKLYSEWNKSNYQENKADIRKRHKKNYEENREAVLARLKKYKSENLELVKEQSKNWRLRNQDKVKQWSKDYYENNKEKVLKRTAKNRSKRYKNDPFFALISNMRCRISEALKDNNTRKSKRSHEYLGCTWHELAIHIERQFSQGMTWENKGKWHVDHIIPLASAKTINDLEPLLHFTNLRPLWADDNMKKSNKRTLLI